MEQQTDPTTQVGAGASASLCEPLSNPGRKDIPVAGGKGANLGELIRAGFPVPDGFVVTTPAYDLFVEQNGLGETISRALRDEPGNGATIRAAFEAAPIPSQVQHDILAAYRQLGQGPVAVRSSATAEDLPGAAFAGQQDTFLNMIGPEAVVDAVRRCWASLWTDRAIAYRGRQGIDQETVKLAVVVQRMVPAEVAGVMFTANPVTGARDEIIIDANPGLGEAIVSGLVTPDHFILRKSGPSWDIVERQAGRREVVIRPLSGGGTEHVEGPKADNAPALSDEALRRLAQMGLAIERHFGSPQDIEWTQVSGQFYIVQARPITALPESRPHLSAPERMLAGMFAEMFPVRPYPLDMTTWVHAISQAAVEPIFSLVGIAAPPLEQLFDMEDDVVIRFKGKVSPHPTPGVLLSPLRLLWLSWRYNPTRWKADRLRARGLARARILEARDVRTLSWKALVATVRQALALALPLAGEIRRRYYPRAALAAGLLWVVLAALGRRNLFGTLLSRAESATLEANRALEALAARVRSDPALAQIFAGNEAGDLRAALEQQAEGRSFLAGLRAFLDRYGHREVVLSTSLEPTWKDAPELVLGIIKGMALTEPGREPGKLEWEGARDKVLAHPLLRLSSLRSAVLGLLATARCLGQIREDTHFDATRILPILRRTLLEMGRRLVDVGVLDAPEHIFYLKFSELERIGGTWPPSAQLASELRAKVTRRKERWATLEGKPVIDPELYRQSEPAGDALLRGTPGSPGIAEGPACVVHDAAEFGKLRSGDVLVAPYTNPAWTPLFQRAAAVVVDGGAAGSHAAIVAREYGIPAVMGTIDGTRKLTDGQPLRVDGDRGLVFSAPQQP